MNVAMRSVVVSLRRKHRNSQKRKKRNWLKINGTIFIHRTFMLSWAFDRCMILLKRKHTFDCNTSPSLQLCIHIFNAFHSISFYSSTKMVGVGVTSFGLNKCLTIHFQFLQCPRRSINILSVPNSIIILNWVAHGRRHKCLSLSVTLCLNWNFAYDFFFALAIYARRCSVNFFFFFSSSDRNISTNDCLT